jgi:hypothetical protein
MVFSGAVADDEASVDQASTHLIRRAIEFAVPSVLNETNAVALSIANAKMTIAAFQSLKVGYRDASGIKVVAELIRI